MSHFTSNESCTHQFDEGVCLNCGTEYANLQPLTPFQDDLLNKRYLTRIHAPRAIHFREMTIPREPYTHLENFTLLCRTLLVFGLRAFFHRLKLRTVETLYSLTIRTMKHEKACAQITLCLILIPAAYALAPKAKVPSIPSDFAAAIHHVSDPKYPHHFPAKVHKLTEHEILVPTRRCNQNEHSPDACDMTYHSPILPGDPDYPLIRHPAR